jgi:hypothetical protein
MKTINDYRKDHQDLRDSILIDIFKYIREQPNWYMKIQDVNGKLLFDDNDGRVIMSVTVKDFVTHGEKAVVWVGTHEEDDYTTVEGLPIELMINVLEAMWDELE